MTTKHQHKSHDLRKPRLLKIVVNTGVGRMSQQSGFEDKILPNIIESFGLLTGQRPAPAKARKSIAGFKLREGQIVGLKATLRHQRMHDFLTRLVGIVLPRVRDFSGIDSKNVDQSGNLSFGLHDSLVFPEINPETAKVDFGLEVSIVSTASNRDEAVEFYRSLGIPLKH